MYWAGGTEFPCLKGKAAEVKHLAAPLLKCCKAHLSADNAQHTQIILGMEMVVQMETILDSYPDDFVLPAHAANELKKAAQAFYQLNTALATFYHPRTIQLFHHTIKFHYMLHISEMAAYIHPRLCWCYAGEDLMGIARTIVQSAQRGVAPHLHADKAMRKYIQGLGMSFLPEIWRK